MDEDEKQPEETEPETGETPADETETAPTATIEDALARIEELGSKLEEGFAKLAERIDASVAVAVENGAAVGEPADTASAALLDADDGLAEELSIDDLDFNLGKDED